MTGETAPIPSGGDHAVGFGFTNGRPLTLESLGDVGGPGIERNNTLYALEHPFEGASPLLPNGLLKWVLYTVDACAIAAAWLVGLRLATGIRGARLGLAAELTLAGAAVVGGLALIASAGLYRRRNCQVRSQETLRLGYSIAAGAVLAYLLAPRVAPQLYWPSIATASVLSFFSLTAGRDAYRAWIAHRRLEGRYGTPVVVIGGEETRSVADLLAEQPDLGMRVLGVVSPWEYRPTGAVPWMGDVEDAVEAVCLSDATGVIVAGGSLPGPTVNELARAFSVRGLHVHIVTGLTGVDAARLRISPLVDEPALHVEPSRSSRMSEAVKRLMDVSIASGLLIAVSPILAVAAAAIRLTDRGPVLFRQRRVGRDGRTFDCLKLRTMVVDAEDRHAELFDANERTGPLFKMDRDPRTTSVGRVLRATSIDELPQLINVLRGEMSLVGPRPALPEEVALFDARLRRRELVRPGITGLWQVEGRDHPSFDRYRRLDLHYVDNWSLRLDLAILYRTVTVVALRSLLAVLRPIVRHTERVP